MNKHVFLDVIYVLDYSWTIYVFFLYFIEAFPSVFLEGGEADP